MRKNAPQKSGIRIVANCQWSGIPHLRFHKKMLGRVS